jgi:choline dehydrogenase-like flavoprotein
VDYIERGSPLSNLEVVTNQYVDKVILEASDQGSPKAAAIGIQNSKGDTRIIRAGKEIILTAGAYGTPAILLRSGIGPKDELEQIGVHPEVQLPGVGKNLMDHMVSTDIHELEWPYH